MESNQWVLKRQDDHGNQYIVASFESEKEANTEMLDYERKGHKQMFWVEEANYSNLKSTDRKTELDS